MEMDVERIDMETEAAVVVLNTADAEELGVNPLDRVRIVDEDQETTGIVDITEELVPTGTMGVTDRLEDLHDGVSVELAKEPQSVEYIRKKLDDNELTRHEIQAIIDDINANRLNDVEMGAYVSAIYANGMSLRETIDLTEVMTDAGDVLNWDAEIVADKHSIGGVAGNRVTPILVPIIAATGIMMPKTSSRAITSPAGTADTMEVFCDVAFSLEEIKEIVDETNACMVWGGAVNLSPVDDEIIRAEHPLSLDPEGQVLASVLSKKKSAGSTHLVIDIPYGKGAKVEDLNAARRMAQDFSTVGETLGMKMTCAITRGEEPIGNGIGPVLEARDILHVLQGSGPQDLRQKSIALADALFDICDVDADAEEILESGEALAKFREIIAAQNGDPDISVDELEPGDEMRTVSADRSGIIRHIDNRAISAVARRAGAPTDMGAGVDLHYSAGDSVSEGDVVFTIHAENAEKLDEAERVLADTTVVQIGEQDESLVERL